MQSRWSIRREADRNHWTLVAVGKIVLQMVSLSRAQIAERWSLRSANNSPREPLTLTVLVRRIGVDR